MSEYIYNNNPISPNGKIKPLPCFITCIVLSIISKFTFAYIYANMDIVGNMLFPCIILFLFLNFILFKKRIFDITDSYKKGIIYSFLYCLLYLVYITFENMYPLIFLLLIIALYIICAPSEVDEDTKKLNDKIVEFDKKFDELQNLEYKLLKLEDYFADKKYPEVRALCKYLIARGVKNERIYWMLSFSLFELNECESAIRFLDKIIDDYPDNYKYYELYACCHHQLCNFEEAITNCNNALELYPDNDFMLYCRGSLYSKLSKFELAKRDFEKALSLGFEDKFTIYYLLAEIYRDHYKNYQKALEFADLAIIENPNDEEPYFLKGSIYCDNLHKYSIATKYFDKVLELNKDNYLYYNFAAYAYIHKGEIYEDINPEQSLQDYKKALKYYRIGYDFSENNSVNYEATVGFAEAKIESLINKINHSGV